MAGLLLFILGVALIGAGFTIAGVACCALPIVVSAILGDRR